MLFGLAVARTASAAAAGTASAAIAGAIATSSTRAATVAVMVDDDVVVVIVHVCAAIANVVSVVVDHYVVVTVNVNVAVAIIDHNVAAGSDVNVMSRLDIDVMSRLDINVMSRLNVVILLDRRAHDRRRRYHALRGRSRNDHLLKERLTVAEAIKIEAVEAAPRALEDEKLLLVVVAPVFAYFIALGIDDLELIAIARGVGIGDINPDVQILLRACFGRRGRSRMRLIEPRDARMVPRQRVGRLRG